MDAGGTIRFLHLSFSDFLLDPSRCSDPLFHPNASALVVIHSKVLLGTLNIMNSDLNDNICRIGAPSHSNSGLRDLDHRLQRYVTPDVAYASKYWIAHMKRVPPSPAARADLTTVLYAFCRAPITLWIEVAGLLGCSDLIIQALECAISWWGQGPELESSPIDHIPLLPLSIHSGQILRVLNDAVAFIHGVKLRMESIAARRSLWAPSRHYSESAAIVMFASEGQDCRIPGDEPRASFILRMVHDVGRLSPFETYHSEGPTHGYAYPSITAISGDGTVVAAARGASIVICDGPSGVHVVTLLTPDELPVTDLHFSSNGRYLAASTSATTSDPPTRSSMLIVYTTRESVWEVYHVWEDAIPARNRLGAVSSDGQFIATHNLAHRAKRDDDHIRLKCIQSHKDIVMSSSDGDDSDDLLLRYFGSGEMTCLAFSPDSRALVAAYPYGQVEIWDIVATAERLPGRRMVPNSLCGRLLFNKELRHLWLEFSRDGKRLSCGNRNGDVLTFDIDTSGAELQFVCINKIAQDAAKGLVEYYKEPVPAVRVRWVYVLKV